MKHAWEKSLDLKHNLFVYLYILLIGNVFKFHALHINNDLHLIDALLITVVDFLALLELDPPSVLELLDEVVH